MHNEDDTMADYYRDQDEIFGLYPREPVWITKDKRVIPVNEMTDEHLLNTIAMLRRNVSRYQLETLIPMTHYFHSAPDGAAAAVSMEMDIITSMTDDEFLAVRFPVFTHLLAQARGRGILRRNTGATNGKSPVTRRTKRTPRKES